MITFIENETNKITKENINNSTPFAFVFISNNPRISKIKLQHKKAIVVKNSFMSINSVLLADSNIIHCYVTSYGSIGLNISPYFEINVIALSDKESLICYPEDDKIKQYKVKGNSEYILKEIEKSRNLISSLQGKTYEV